MKERKPRSCTLRTIEPKGPMRGCENLECFPACVELTRQERENLELAQGERKPVFLGGV